MEKVATVEAFTNLTSRSAMERRGVRQTKRICLFCIECNRRNGNFSPGFCDMKTDPNGG